MDIIFHTKSIYKENRGITLTELLVASVLIGIVMLGVASFSVAISSLQRSTDKSVIIALKTKAAMARVTKDASLAVGHQLDRGIVEYSSGVHLSICFRHDSPETPQDYTDDTWACYYRQSAQNQLMLCGSRAAAGVPVEDGGIGVQGCANGGSQLLLMLDPADNVFYQVIENSSSRLKHIEITLSTILDGASPWDPITNPRYTTTTQISPSGHSR